GAPQRCAEERVRGLGTGEHRAHQPHPADPGDRDGFAPVKEKSMASIRSHSDERGIAMILALFMLLATSIIGASVMHVSRRDTVASQNYREMSQERYAAESGVHKAVNFLLNNYVAPSDTSLTDPLTNYTITVSPLTYANAAPVLSAMTGVGSNY